MNAKIFAVSLWLVAANVFAQPVVIQGDELKTYVVGEKGYKFTIADGETISFFPDGTFINCNPKQDCDGGTYAIEPTRVIRKYDSWKLNGSSLMPITFKKDGADEFFNVRKIASRNEDVALRGDEFKNLIMTEKGSTWTTSNGSRLTFLPNGQLIHCAGEKPGHERCDDGTYVLADNSIERKYNTWYRSTGGLRKVGLKKNGDKLTLGGLDVVKYSPTPTLLPATNDQIMSLAGKNFKQNYLDQGLQVMNFSKGMTLFTCSNTGGCGTSLPLKVVAPWVELTFIGRVSTIEWKSLVAVEDGFFLWDGRKFIPQ